MNIKSIVFILLSLIFCCVSSYIFGQKRSLEQSFKKAASKFYGNSLTEFETVPGVSIVVVKGQKTLFNQGFGYADLEQKIPVDSQTNFYIASSTKSFTGLLATLLDAEGVIKLDDPLTKYFPNTPFPETLKADEIKVRDLLTHTAGLENDPLGFRVAFTGNHDFQTRLKLMEYCKPNQAGKDTFSYDNVGYNIYAIILEKVTGKSWKDHLAERIFEPLGMNHTTAYISKAEAEKWAMALPYMGRASDNIQEVYLKKKDNTMQAAGGLISNGEDLASWLKAQISNGKGFFPQEVMETCHAPLVKGATRNPLFKGEGYGMGWQIGSYNGEKTIWHFGGFGGFLTHISFMPEQEIGVAVMINEGIAGNRLKDLYAGFAYDYLMGKIDDVDAYAKKSTQLNEQLSEGLKQIIAHENDRAKRESQLTLDLEKYTGKFVSDQYGEINVALKSKELSLSFGNLHCIATAYTQRETIRVGWIPGSGSVIDFEVNDGEVEGFRYMGVYFEKVEGRD